MTWPAKLRPPASRGGSLCRGCGGPTAPWSRPSRWPGGWYEKPRPKSEKRAPLRAMRGRHMWKLRPLLRNSRNTPPWATCTIAIGRRRGDLHLRRDY